MSDKISRKALLKQDDQFIEAGLDIGEWLEAHWRQVAKVGGAVLGIVVLLAAWTGWRGLEVRKAKGYLAEGLAKFAPDTGDSKPAEALPLFERAAAAAGGNAVGQVATFYRGKSLLDLGRAGEAIPLLEEVASKADDRGLADSARAVLAQAHEKAGNLDKAAVVLEELSRAKDALFPADEALLRLGKVRRLQGREADAKQAWQEIVTRFPQADAAGEARTLLSGAP